MPENSALFDVQPEAGRYPLVIEEAYDIGGSDGELSAFFSRGHHSVEKFAAAVRSKMPEFDLDEDAFGLVPLDLSIQQGYWRDACYDAGEYGYESAESSTSPGAFPVTYVEVDWD